MHVHVHVVLIKVCAYTLTQKIHNISTYRSPFCKNTQILATMDVYTMHSISYYGCVHHASLVLE